MAALIQLSFRNNLLQPVRQWLEAIEVHDPKVARLLCKMIPAHCPFERHLRFGDTVLHIPYGSLREDSISPQLPPLCKLNPLYEQVISLRFKCLSYLADECGEDVTLYC